MVSLAKPSHDCVAVVLFVVDAKIFVHHSWYTNMRVTESKSLLL